MTGQRRPPSDAWRALAADEDAADAAEVAALLDDGPTEQLGSLMGDVVERLVGVLLQGPPASVREELLGRLRVAASRAAADGTAIPADGRGLLAAGTLLTCLPGPAPVEPPGRVAATWAPRAARIVDQLDVDACHDWALACAAHGLDDLVEVFLDVPEPSPGAAALARAVVAARDDSERAVVTEAWTAFVDGFPAAYDARGVLLSSLLHAAWAVHVRLGGGDPREVPGVIQDATGLEWDPS
ncbi:hypothetical protein [Nocardioides aequoreus]|uniref:hypothetical protein n=1 Tax=Nocardioides aequoreus TaxID=397278 RepID=UPI0004C3FD21|nr:hypothetical protein [Nocardioides aequoreus]